MIRLTRLSVTLKPVLCFRCEHVRDCYITMGEHTKCETSEVVITISPTHSAANQMITTTLNFRKSVNLGTIPTATAVASPPTGEGIKLGWVNMQRLRVHVRPPARAHVTTRATIQLFAVRIFTLHAKNS